MNNEEKRQKIWFYLKIIIPIGLLLYLFNTIDYASFFKILQGANKWILLIPLLLANLDIMLDAYKWKYILKKMGHRLKWKSLTNLYYQGNFLNNFFPSSSGGDGYKFVVMSKRIRSRKDAFISILIDRGCALFILGLLFLFSIVSFLILFNELAVEVVKRFSKVIIFLIFMLLVISVLLFVWKRFKAFHEKFMPSIKKAFSLVDLKTILLSIPFYTIMIINHYLVSIAFNINIEPIYFLTFLPIILILIFSPISVNGVGIREYSFIFFFGLIGITKEAAFFIAFTPYFIRLISSMVGGILMIGSRNKDIHEEGYPDPEEK